MSDSGRIATENKVPCFLCNGTGAVMGDAPGLVTSCITCSGTGYVPSSTPSAFPMLTPTKLELCEKYGVHGIDYHERAEFVIQLCRAARAFITSSAKGTFETPESPQGEEAQVAGQATNGASGDNPGRCGSVRTLADSNRW